MRFELSKTTSFLAAALLSLAACAGDAEVQKISGKITLSSFRAPVEGVRAMQGSTVIATGRVATDGSFSLAVPAGSNYRLEVVTRKAPYDLLVKGKNGSPRVAAFNVCAGEDPFDMGEVDYWDEEGGDPLPCPPDVPPEECGDPCPPDDPGCLPPDDPCAENPDDPACLPPDDPCLENPELCWPPDDPCIDNPDDPACLPPDDPCAEDPEACLPPECPPEDPDCLPPEPCDPSTDPDCLPPDDPCASDPEACLPPDCPEGTDPETCWPDDPGCPYDDPECWPDPLPPPDCDDPSNPDCGSDSGDGAVPDNPLPDFGC